MLYNALAMTLPVQEKLKANIVVLSGSEGTIALSSEEIKPILRDATAQVIGQPAQQMQLTSLREQILVIMSGGRLVFEDQSDAIPPKVRLAEIVEGFVQLFASKGISQYRAYGFNFDIAFDARGDSPAAQLIMERFVRADQLSQRGNICPDGSGLRLYFGTGEARCDLRIEPLENKVNSPRYFSHINYHYDLPTGQFPQLDILRSDFQGKWGLFVDLLERLLIKP
jgi:hypothetical protein